MTSIPTVPSTGRADKGWPVAVPVTLSDGTSAWLRSAQPSDAVLLAALFDRASRHALWLRFFTAKMTVDRRFIAQMVDTDGEERVTFLVTRGEAAAESILGVGSYVRLPVGDAAEVAFFVDEPYHGRGIGTLLLEQLAEYARHHGIVKLIADVLPANFDMLDVFRKSGFEPHFSADFQVTHVELAAAASPAEQDQADSRERIATAASLAPLLRPRSVAVVGASRRAGTIGRAVFDRLLQGGFVGPVYPVNPDAHAVGSVRAYPTVLDIPDEIDLVIVAVPAEQVRRVVDDSVRKRVRALVVLSAGFAETGDDGARHQQELLRTVRANGMRMVGPNCVGVLNTAPAVSLNATFGPGVPTAGRIGMSSQSGALGLAILDCATEYQLGVSTFVAVGNKADVSTNDLLQFWETDAATDVIALYVESFGNPRKFARIARRVARQKPILALKSGRSPSGARAARSHTAALAGNDRAVAALFQQAGVIRAETLDELFHTAALLVHQPLPRGNRVAVVTNAGGPAILAADACEVRGLRLPPLAPDTIARLREDLPPSAGLNNPVDMIASAGPDAYRTTVSTVLQDPSVDALIAIFIPTGLTDVAAVATAIRQGIDEAGNAGSEKPVQACFMMSGPPPAAFEASPNSGTAASARTIPSVRFPEAAAVAMSNAALYSDWRARPEGVVPNLAGVAAEAARCVMAAALAANGEGWLRPDAAAQLLEAAGIDLPAWTCVTSAEEAVAAAEQIGFPVAVKAVGATLVHKSEIGGVALNLNSGEAVRSTCSAMRQQIGAGVEGFLVQRMAESGTEILVGVVEDASFGPLIGFGLGGTAVEVLNDVVFRITPLTDEDARVMVRSIKGLPLLQGYRGRAAADLGALEELLLRVSWLVETVPGIIELDLNPIMVYAAGRSLSPVDVRIRVRESA